VKLRPPLSRQGAEEEEEEEEGVVVLHSQHKQVMQAAEKRHCHVFYTTVFF
jgi:hypothetical protein